MLNCYDMTGTVPGVGRVGMNEEVDVGMRLWSRTKQMTDGEGHEMFVSRWSLTSHKSVMYGRCETAR